MDAASETPRPGWYPVVGFADDNAYFDGERWTAWRRGDAEGRWRRVDLLSGAELWSEEIPDEAGTPGERLDPEVLQGPVYGSDGEPTLTHLDVAAIDDTGGETVETDGGQESTDAVDAAVFPPSELVGPAEVSVGTLGADEAGAGPVEASPPADDDPSTNDAVLTADAGTGDARADDEAATGELIVLPDVHPAGGEPADVESADVEPADVEPADVEPDPAVTDVDVAAFVTAPAVPAVSPEPAVTGSPTSSDVGSAEGSSALWLHVPDPVRQSRWTVGVRLLLALPNVAVMLLVLAVAHVAVLPMWVVALSKGRVPPRMWLLVEQAMEWEARTVAYSVLLTGKYPPFDIGPAPYPVSMGVGGRPERYNRLAVLFRGILLLPATVVVIVYSAGIWLVALVGWFATLLLGPLPLGLHRLLAAWLRYVLRWRAYASLVTTAYPNRPLGDRRSDEGEGRHARQAEGIVVGRAAKALGIVGVALGVVALGAGIAVPIARHTPVSGKTGAATLTRLESRVTKDQARYRNAVTTCATNLACLGRSATIVVKMITTQLSTVHSLRFPNAKAKREADAALGELALERPVAVSLETLTTLPAYGAAAAHLATLTRQVRPLIAQLEVTLKRSP